MRGERGKGGNQPSIATGLPLVANDPWSRRRKRINQVAGSGYAGRKDATPIFMARPDGAGCAAGRRVFAMRLEIRRSGRQALPEESAVVGQAAPVEANPSLNPKVFLETLRSRLLRATAGMRAGAQRLDLAVEVFWYAALGARTGGRFRWSAITEDGHPLQELVGPVRLMLRSELIHAGARLPDALVDDVLQQVLRVAEHEAELGRRDEILREDFTTWLRRRMAGVGSRPDFV